MTRTGRRIVLGIAVTALTSLIFSACSQPRAAEFEIGEQRYSSANRTQFKLPKVLREVSGLSLDADGRLFAVNDEAGIIYQIDYQAGRVLKQFSLQGGVKDDFEGIASSNGHVYLVSSKGQIYRADEGAAGQTVSFQRFNERLDCEVEGLTYSAILQALLVACKVLADDDERTGLRIHRWSLSDESYDPASALVVPHATLKAFLSEQGHSTNKLQPTGITTAGNGNLIIVAGRQYLLLELTTAGELIGTTVLKKSRHPQTEGIAITASGQLLLTDEGDGKGEHKSRGRLSIYEPGG